jgi:hypothetical protein
MVAGEIHQCWHENSCIILHSVTSRATPATVEARTEIEECLASAPSRYPVKQRISKRLEWVP